MKKILPIILLLLLCLISCKPVSESEPDHESDIVIERIESYLNDMEQVGFSGVVLVELNEKKVISNGYGFSDREKELRNTPTTLFDIGSITKQFTAAAILKLEMDGKLTVQDTISMYFDNIPDDKIYITIHDLLRHQSGLQSGVGRDYDPVTEPEFLELVFESPLQSQTGTSFGYSNIGYSLLALIVEKMSGESYENYLYQHLWKPAGMESTGYTRPGFNPDSVAVVYRRDDTVWGKPTEMAWDETAPYWHLTGNGGVISTAEDMYKWHLALLDDKILSDEAKQKLYHPEIRDDEDTNTIYAYGWDVSTTKRDTRLVWHNGSNGFYYADFHRFVDEGIALIMLTNKSHPNFNSLNREITRIIFDADYSPIIPHPDNIANREFTTSMIQTITEVGLDEAKQEYDNRPSGVELLNFQMRNAGFNFLFNTGETDHAVAVFTFNAMIFPDSAPALRGLAEAYMETGQKEMAIEYFRKSLAVDPDSPFANEMLANLLEES